jgi:uncharacterized protein (TIGR02466 family)
MSDTINIDLTQQDYGMVQPWFPKLVYFKDGLFTDQLESWTDIVREQIENSKIKYTSELAVKSNHGNSNLLEIDELKPLWEAIADHSQWFVGYMGYLNFELQLVNAWANISTKGDYLFPHTHPGSLISGAFYLKSSPADNILFMDQESSLMRPSHPHEMTWNKVTYQCQPGRLLLFKSDTLHGVTRQQDEEEKIVISFNLIGKYL